MEGLQVGPEDLADLAGRVQLALCRAVLALADSPAHDRGRGLAGEGDASARENAASILTASDRFVDIAADALAPVHLVLRGGAGSDALHHTLSRLVGAATELLMLLPPTAPVRSELLCCADVVGQLWDRTRPSR